MPSLWAGIRVIEVIATEYSGTLFRSRLEARWAVFFTELDVPYEYEPEGLTLDGVAYLPDFWLPEQRTLVEIKPQVGNLDTRPEHRVFTWMHSEQRPLEYPEGHFPQFLILVGSPGLECQEVDGYGVCQRFTYNGFILGDCYYRWTECPYCHAVGVEFDGRSGRLRHKAADCPCSEKVYYTHSPRLLAAYAAAKRKRFWNPQ